MSKAALPYRLTGVRPPQIGLIVLQADETIEPDFRRLMPREVDLLVSRLPSGAEVTADTLSAQEAHLTASAALFPVASHFSAVGYGCTSGTAQIGAAEVARRIRAGTPTQAVTEPLSATIAACRALGLGRLALVSPYIAPVSDRLRQAFAGAGIETPGFGSFEVAEEAQVVRIDADSIMRATEKVAGRAEVDGVFLSCTNLRTLEAIRPLEARLGLPVLSSNLVLAWHLLQLAGIASAPRTPGELLDPAG